LENFWKNFLLQINEKTSPQVFETWFKPLILVDCSQSCVTIGVPKKFFSDWLNENYRELINGVIFNITKTTPDIKFSVCPETPEVVSEKPNPKAETKNYYVPKNINGNYTFDNFVVGTSNQFANAACQAVANNPGETYNPLFLYSGSGLGKTHLLHAIVHQCLKNNKNTKIYYVTSEQFTNELINSIRYNKMLDFRNKYRNIDVLLLDDIQFIAGKERTQEEFFHTFNSLFELKKQIVVTSDTSPREINKLEERIRSRFQWGLIADMQPPETETRVAILKKKALEKNISLTNDVAFLLANSVTSNIRELEGLLTRLTAFSSLMGRDITVDFTKDVLKDFIKTDDRETTPEEIQKTVSKYYNIKLSELKGKKKSSSIVLPRQVAMYLTRQLTTLSLPEVGQQFSGKDHSTVIYSVKKIDGLIKKDKKIKNDIDQLLKKF